MADAWASGARRTSHDIVQRKVKVGTDIYEKWKRGFTSEDLIAEMEAVAEDEGTELKWGYKGEIRDAVKSLDLEIDVADMSTLVGKFAKLGGSNQKRKIREQDGRILGLYGTPTDQQVNYGQILAYEQAKAFAHYRQNIMQTGQYTSTLDDINGLNAGGRSATNDFTHTTLPPVMWTAFGQSEPHRLDYQYGNNVEVDIRAYSSRKDRTVDAQTLGSGLGGYGPIKIGPNIGAYGSEMKTNDRPPQQESRVLTSLEMFRLPFISAMTGLKRHLYEEDDFTKEQGMGNNHAFSSVEFVGAVSGSGMNSAEKSHMRKQQFLSSYHILKECSDNFPNQKINDSMDWTFKGLYDLLVEYASALTDTTKTQEQRDEIKSKMRGYLYNLIVYTSHMEGVPEVNKNQVPSSPAYQSSYDDYEIS